MSPERRADIRGAVQPSFNEVCRACPDAYIVAALAFIGKSDELRGSEGYTAGNVIRSETETSYYGTA
jgi:hypothetical protein